MSQKHRARSARLDPAVARFQLALRLQREGRLSEAEQAYRQAISLAPGLAEAHNNLGIVLDAAGNAGEALQCFRRAVELQPDYFVALVNLAKGLHLENRHHESIPLLERAVRLGPDHAEAHHLLGLALNDTGQLQLAQSALKRALELAPTAPRILGNLGLVELRLGHYHAAIRHCEAAIALDASIAPLFNILGSALKDLGRLDEAIPALRRAIEIDPGELRLQGTLLFALNYVCGMTPEQLFEEHLEMERRYAPGVTRIEAHSNDRDPGRPLRVGYLSPDFREHSVAYFIGPVLEAHSAAGVSIFCYSDNSIRDQVTEHLRTLVPHWRDVHTLSDEDLARTIQDDRIDILVDLAGHTARGRPMLLARKPAPVQVTYLGYPNTTGLTAVDYRITDEIADPPGMTEHLHTERLVRITGGFLAYSPRIELEEGPPPPCCAGRGVTFASFNVLSKVNGHVIAVWSRILHEVPGSRLLVKAKPFQEEGTRARVCGLFAAEGIPADRLELVSRIPGRDGHLRLYDRVDVALDPFPYNGTTTTCEALWMGVPVVTMAGQHHASRVGGSLLTAIGREEWVAGSEDEYVAIAAGLARDPARLATLRFGMRRLMRRSPLLDHARIARELEAAYRDMWRSWCEVPVTHPSPLEMESFTC